MLKSLLIQNYQSHRKTKIVFTPGVNWIIGESDSGKSGIVRALRWAWYNKPYGFAFRSTWSTKEPTQVVVEHTDTPTITRTRTTSTNTYSVGDLELTAFGNDVPEAVAAAANIGEINLQQQGDDPFLLKMIPAEVARYLNSIANLTIIDDTHTRMAGMIRTCDAEIATATKEKKEAENSLQQFGDLDDIQAVVDRLALVEQSLSHYQSSLALLQRTLSNLQSVIVVIDVLQIESAEATRRSIETLSSVFLKRCADAERLLSITTHLEDVLEKIRVIEEASATYTEQRSLHRRAIELVDTEKRCAVLTALLNSTKCAYGEIDKLQGIDNVAATLSAHTTQAATAATLDKQHTNLKVAVSMLCAVDQECDQISKSLTELEKRRTDAFPDVCPLCGTEMKK